MPAKPKQPKAETPQVNARHPQFIDALPLWEQIRDCMDGEKTVKAQKTKYLPKPNAADTSPENDARYSAYILRAVFSNFTGRTVENLVGQCFAVDPVFTGPEALQPIIDDIDGGGVSATQQSKKALAHVVAFSRGGVFVDYPDTQGNPVSVADAESGGIRAKVLFFKPWEIINWRVVQVGAQAKLSLVVIEESYVKEDDGFAATLGKRYRVLRLSEGVYTVEVWEATDSNGFAKVREATPKDGSGKPFSEIPFTFIGAESNAPDVQKPLMLDISSLNLAHYRNSADYEESVFYVGQPTPYLAGLTEQWVNDVLKGKIMLGSRAAIPLPEGATAGLLQATANTLPKEAMDQKEALMISLGAKLVEKREVKRTATEAGLDEASTTSVLASCCKNVSAAYARALEWVCQFQAVTIPAPTNGATGGLLFELNTDFAVARMTPEEMTAILGLFNGNLVTFEEARDKLKSGGVAYLDDEDAKDQMDAQAEADFAKAQAELDAQTAAQERLIAAKGGSNQPPAK